MARPVVGATLGSPCPTTDIGIPVAARDRFPYMKHVLGFLGILALSLLLLNIASPARGQEVVSRIIHFVDPVPPTPAFD